MEIGRRNIEQIVINCTNLFPLCFVTLSIFNLIALPMLDLCNCAKKRSKKEEADQILAILFFCQIYFWQTEPLWLMVIGQKTASAILQGSRYNWRTCRAHGRTKILNLIFAPINLQLKFIISELQLFQFFKIKHHKFHLISFYLHQLIC